jgi:hypothetical protein
VERSTDHVTLNQALWALAIGFAFAFGFLRAFGL